MSWEKEMKCKEAGLPPRYFVDWIKVDSKV